MNICFEGVFGPRAVGLGLSIKELFPSLAADQNHLWSWRNTDAQSSFRGGRHTARLETWESLDWLMVSSHHPVTSNSDNRAEDVKAVSSIPTCGNSFNQPSPSSSSGRLICFLSEGLNV